MSLVLDKFFSVDLSYQMYKELISLWEITSPLTKYCDPVVFTYNKATLTRLLLSSYSSQIARVNEIILDLEDTQKKEDYEKKITDYMNSIIAFARIVPKVPLDSVEIKQKIKNALAHAEYDLIYDDNGNVQIEIDTNFIKGYIPLEDMDELFRFYTSICDDLDVVNKYFTGLDDLFNIKTNNVEILKNAINKIGICDYDVNRKLPGNITIFDYGYNKDAISLDDKSKKLILDYIRYIGISNWVNLSYGQKNMLFAKHFKFIIDGKCNFRNSSQNIYQTIDYCVLKGNGDTSKNDIYNLSFEAPCIYAGLILDLGFLCLNYIKEALAKEELNNFNYRNINLGSIKYNPCDCVKEVTSDEEKNKLKGPISDLEAKRNRLISSINKKRNNLLNLDKALSLSEDDRITKKNEIQKKIDSDQVLLDDVNDKLAILYHKYNTSCNYVDTNDFFKHLRNSISHGFYTIDYSKALAKKDLSKIVFKFQDWDIDKNNRKNRKLVFETEISAFKLLDLFEQLEDRLKISYDTMDKYEDKSLLSVDLRNNKNGSNRKIDDYLDTFKEKGFILKKIKL